MRPSPLILALGALFGGAAQAQDCSRQTLDFFDLSRRARNILTDLHRADAHFGEAVALYQDELPSEPGYFGVGFVFDLSDLGAFPVCAADGTRSLDLVRSLTGARTRWQSSDAETLVEFVFLSSHQALTRPGVEIQTNPDGTMMTVPTSTPYLQDTQRYYGLRVQTGPWIDITLGLLDMSGVRFGEVGAQIPGVVESDPGLRTALRVALPAANGAAVSYVINDDVSTPESALLDVPIDLPHDFGASAQLAWLGDEERAVLRASLTDPWDILTADLGVETSGALLRHGRLSGQYLTPTLGRLFRATKTDGPVSGFERMIAFYVRFGIDAEVSRFSGQHLEDVTGKTGVNGWALQGMMVFHMLFVPIRTQVRIGTGRNRVDVLEHAAAFADRDEFIADISMTLGW